MQVFFRGMCRGKVQHHGLLCRSCCAGAFASSAKERLNKQQTKGARGYEPPAIFSAAPTPPLRFQPERGWKYGHVIVHPHKVLMSLCSALPSFAWMRGSLKAEIPGRCSSGRDRDVAISCAQDEVADVLQKTDSSDLHLYRSRKVGYKCLHLPLDAVPIFHLERICSLDPNHHQQFKMYLFCNQFPLHLSLCISEAPKASTFSESTLNLSLACAVLWYQAKHPKLFKAIVVQKYIFFRSTVSMIQ